MRLSTFIALSAAMLGGAALAQPPAPPAPPAPPPQQQGQAPSAEPARDTPAAQAENEAQAAPRPDRPEPTVVVEDVIRQLSETTGRAFLLDPRLPSRLHGGGTVQPPYDYAAFLAILRINGFMAVDIDGYVNIVPDQNARQAPTPMVLGDDENIASDEWVTRVLTLPENVSAAQLVPVLRPMQGQNAHLTAIRDEQSNVVVIVDRYANVKRLTDIIRIIESRAASSDAAD